MRYLFYIMGKSSSGKDTIYKRLTDELHLKPVVIYTTRPMREDEQDGREYFFVDRERFQKMLSDGEIIEKRVYNTAHGEWIYFTAYSSIDTSEKNCIGIGTPESFVKLREYFGDAVIPVYIEVEDGIRLARAVERERNEVNPKYKELCRRFLADCDDFSEKNLLSAGIIKRFQNNSDIDSCINEIKRYIVDKLL